MNVKAPKHLKDLGVPTIKDINSDIPLPDTVPLEYLASGKPVKQVPGKAVVALVEKLVANKGWFQSAAAVQQSAPQIHGLFGDSDLGQEVDPNTLMQYGLAADLLFKVAKVAPSHIQELRQAVQDNNGYAASLIDSINARLAKALNFPHWWTQDSQFELYVTCTELDLKFMIRDRTGKSYSFAERSDGMKYFLSYFVQYLAHESAEGSDPELLLMDEPDQYLSSSAQQDLLRIFEDFAHPQDPDRQPVQVVYVTHSPFLIDKNEARRIRVLEKGEYDEGTRVISSVAANHYEPLRSAFGSFVAETTFISGSNLIIEGPSDQVLLAGATRWLKSQGVADRDRLDLNSVTMVPAGGTQHVPYIVFLARGRDVEKPAVVVLLDADGPGDQARKDLQAAGPKRKPLVDDRLVLQFSDPRLSEITSCNPAGCVAIEDLLPLNLAIDAAVRFCRNFVPAFDVASYELSEASVFPNGAKDGKKGLVDALQHAIRSASGNDEFDLPKIGFARSVIEILNGNDDSRPERRTTDSDLKTTRRHFTLLLSTLAQLERDARRAKDVDRISTKINRVKREFKRTHPKTARREDVRDLIEEIETQLDYSVEADSVRESLARWRETFKLADDPAELIDDYDQLMAAVDSLAYQATRASQPEVSQT
jgi:hypothetical protein